STPPWCPPTLMVDTILEPPLLRRQAASTSRVRRIGAGGEMTDRLVWTDEGRRAFIAAGGHPGAHGGHRAKRRFT
ncbi:hypothetical protein ACFW16_35250, partial [Inquilinus sp. NPDC058860]|uniref:hypothetical protein n=1 Tax=Inquilinus sp. NPDC058860 TaxID=3346652 RepID=UPI0036BF7C50